MKNKSLKSLKEISLLLLILFGIFACSDHVNTAQGGATSESTNGIVLIKALALIDSSEVSDSKIKIFQSGLHPDSSDIIVFEGDFEEDGSISFETPDNGEYYIEVYSKDIGRRFQQTFESDQDYDLEDIYLDSFSNINGTVELLKGTPTKVFLPGSDKIITTDETGNYSLKDVSPGTYDVMFETLDQVIVITPMGSDEVNLGTSDGFEDDYDRKLIAEILSKNTDSMVDIDDIATFVVEGTKERLTHINLSSLGIAPEDMDGTGIPRMSNLQVIEVDMSNNGLYKIPQNWGWKWDKIERLNLSDNQIVQIPSSFKDITTMKVLDLRNNQLKTIRDDVILMELDSIYVGNNHLVNEPIEIQEWLDTYAEDNWRELQTDP